MDYSTKVVVQLSVQERDALFAVLQEIEADRADSGMKHEAAAAQRLMERLKEALPGSPGGLAPLFALLGVGPLVTREQLCGALMEASGALDNPSAARAVDAVDAGFAMAAQALVLLDDLVTADYSRFASLQERARSLLQGPAARPVDEVSVALDSEHPEAF